MQSSLLSLSKHLFSALQLALRFGPTIPPGHCSVDIDVSVSIAAHADKCSAQKQEIARGCDILIAEPRRFLILSKALNITKAPVLLLKTPTSFLGRSSRSRCANLRLKACGWILPLFPILVSITRMLSHSPQVQLDRLNSIAGSRLISAFFFCSPLVGRTTKIHRRKIYVFWLAVCVRTDPRMVVSNPPLRESSPAAFLTSGCARRGFHCAGLSGWLRIALCICGLYLERSAHVTSLLTA